MSNSRGCAGHTCGGQFAHAPSRRRAVCNGRLVTRVAACNASAACKAVRSVCFFPAHLRWAIHAPCFCLRQASHARGFFRVQAHAGLLFSWAGKKPVSCSLRQGESPPQTSINEKNVGPNVPQRTETPEKLELCSLAFRAFPLSAGGLRPEGPLSRPAARKRGRSAKGHRRPPLHRNA